MAIIGEIRKKQGWILGLLGLALAAFVVMGMKSQFNVGSGQAESIGTVNGKNIDYKEFDRASNAVGSTGDEYSKRSYLWNYFVEKNVVEGYAEEMGMGVDPEEMAELTFGQNLSPIIQQRFQNQQTRQVDRGQLNQIKAGVEAGKFENPKFKPYWDFTTAEVKKDRIQTKIISLVTKSMYMPTWMANATDQEAKLKKGFDYVKVPFDKIKDTEITVTDEDLQKYLDENKATYVKDEEQRIIRYANFEVVATASDKEEIRRDIDTVIMDLKVSTNDTNFVEITSGAVMGATYLKKSELTAKSDVIFELNVGEVYGPYLDKNSYKCVKVVGKKMIPDSVQSRHILLPAKDRATFAAAVDTIKMIQDKIESGQSTFAEMAAKYGTDGTKAKGGDLGFTAQGGMVKPFNDLIFFDAEVGELYTVGTQFGLHLVEVMANKFINNEEGVKLVTVSRTIVPSEGTQSNMMIEVNQILQDSKDIATLESKLTEKGVVFTNSNPFGVSDYNITNLDGNQVTRDMIKWAYTATANEIAPEVYIFDDKVDYYTSNYVIATLGYIQNAGSVDLNINKEALMPLVTNIKKGEKLTATMSGDMASIASQYNINIDTIPNLSFSSSVIPVIGNEPNVLAKAFELKLGEVSDVIIGDTGVYKIKITSSPDNNGATASVNSFTKKFSVQSLRSRLQAYLMGDMVKAAEVDDMRSKIY